MKICRERTIKKALSQCLRALANLQKAFFVNYLRTDYIKHQLHYQKRLNSCARRFFASIVRSAQLVKTHPQYQEIFNRINHLSEIVFSLNQLRFRVTDYTTFKICQRELEGIEKFSVLLFAELAAVFLKKKSVVNINDFEERIHAFETIYNGTLQIVAVDPVVFMFFIQDLYALNDEIQNLHQAILSEQS